MERDAEEMMFRKVARPQLGHRVLFVTPNVKRTGAGV